MTDEKKRSIVMDFLLGAIGGTAGSLVTYPINAVKAPIEAGIASPSTPGEWVDHTIKHVGDWRKATKVIPMDVAKKSLALGASWAAIQGAVRQLDKWENKTAEVKMTYKELGFEKIAYGTGDLYATKFKDGTHMLAGWDVATNSNPKNFSTPDKAWFYKDLPPRLQKLVKVEKVKSGHEIGIYTKVSKKEIDAIIAKNPHVKIEDARVS